MQAADDIQNDQRDRKKYFTAHILTYHRDKSTGEYRILLGKKSVVSYYLIHQYLYHRQAFRDRVNTILANNSYSNKLKLTKFFNLTSSGQFVTPGGRPKKYISSIQSSSYHTITSQLQELPEDTAAREWLEEIYTLFFDIKINPLLIAQVKKHLVKLHEWPSEYNDNKFGVIYGLNLDALIKDLPEISCIMRDHEIQRINSKLMELNNKLKQLMCDCLSVDRFKEVYSQPAMLISQISEFEYINWTSFDALKYCLEQKNMFRSESFYHWLYILNPVYIKHAKEICDILQIRFIKQLQHNIAQCLNYNYDFIKQAMQVLISQINKNSSLTDDSRLIGQQNNQHETPSLLTQQQMLISLNTIEENNLNSKEQLLPPQNSQIESLVVASMPVNKLKNEDSQKSANHDTKNVNNPNEDITQNNWHSRFSCKLL